MKLKNKKIFLKFFLLISVFGLGFFVFSVEVQAATYYVSTTGSDTKNCTDATTNACATFNYAQTKMSAGDTLIAKAGTYNQTITVNKSGITIQGTLDANGNRLSIIDPYTNVSGGWTLIGDTNSNDVCDESESSCKGVYSKNIGRNPMAMAVQINGIRYKIPRVCQTDDRSECRNHYRLLENPDTKTFPQETNGHNYLVNMWHGFHALFTAGTETSNLTHVSFQDDTSANSLTLYASTSGSSTIIIYSDNVTIKNLDIRAKEYGIFVSQRANVTINNNKIILGRIKIYIDGGTYATISDNIITDQSYADKIGLYPPSAHDGVDYNNGPYEDLVRAHGYSFIKYYLTHEGEANESGGIQIWYTDYATITGNEVGNINNGIWIYQGGYFEVANNYIHHTSSSGFILDIPNGGGIDSSIHDNTWTDSAIAMRFQQWNGARASYGGWNQANIKIYNNKIWYPLHIGTGMSFHYWDGPGTIDLIGELWIYHNSFSGGLRVVDIPVGAKNFGITGMENVNFVNNIMSTDEVYADQSYINNPGVCAYNWLAGLEKNPCLGTGTHDNSTTLMWNPPETADFIPTYSSALNSGIDISQSFTINGKTYPALPGFTAGYGGTDGRPDMGAVQSGDIPDNPADVNNDNSVNIKDIQACVRVITRADLTYEENCKNLVADTPVNVANIKDVQEVVQAIVSP